MNLSSDQTITVDLVGVFSASCLPDTMGIAKTAKHILKPRLSQFRNGNPYQHPRFVPAFFTDSLRAVAEKDVNHQHDSQDTEDSFQPHPREKSRISMIGILHLALLRVVACPAVNGA